MLRDFEMPPGKTPLFAGGSGIVVEKKGKQLVARVYPVTAKSSLDFVFPDGISRALIQVNVSDWKKPSVRAGKGRSAASSWQRHALEFVITPGESYEIY
jgi:hypothetical protein